MIHSAVRIKTLQKFTPVESFIPSLTTFSLPTKQKCNKIIFSLCEVVGPNKQSNNGFIIGGPDMVSGFGIREWILES